MPRVIPEYKEKAKDRIVEAAFEVFSQKGYHDTTMDDVAEKLGVSKGALYQYFKSKEDLYRAILNSRFHGLTDLMRSTAPGGGGFVETCQAFFDNLTKDPSDLGLAFEIISEASRNPALAKVVRENHQETVEVIEKCLEDWKKEGSLRRDINMHRLTEGLVALYYGLMVSLAIGTEKQEVKRTFAEFISGLERSMLRKPP
jgi:AcrR family transcriptional regulator